MSAELAVKSSFESKMNYLQGTPVLLVLPAKISNSSLECQGTDDRKDELDEHMLISITFQFVRPCY